MVVRGQPRGGPPPTRTVAMSNIIAPRLARRGNPTVEGSSDTPDEVNSLQPDDACSGDVTKCVCICCCEYMHVSRFYISYSLESFV